jgi:hypothetical protein
MSTGEEGGGLKTLSHWGHWEHGDHKGFRNWRQRFFDKGIINFPVFPVSPVVCSHETLSNPHLPGATSILLT